jgi:hypothetical protein
VCLGEKICRLALDLRVGPFLFLGNLRDRFGMLNEPAGRKRILLFWVGAILNNVEQELDWPRCADSFHEGVIALSSARGSCAKTGPKADSGQITTVGEILPGRFVIELVSASAGTRPDLLIWNGSRVHIAPRLKHGDLTYEAPELSPSLYSAICLPKRPRNYGSVRALSTRISSLFKDSFCLHDRDSWLLACFCLSSWLADRLSTAPSLVISGSDRERGIEMFRLLKCMCRRPLMLAELTRASLRSLPMHLSPTLLINARELKPNIQHLLWASHYRGLQLPGNRGTFVDLYGPKAILLDTEFAGDDFGEESIRIFLEPSPQFSGFDDSLRDRTAARLQAELLMYRLKNCVDSQHTQVDVSHFTSTTRRLAHALAGCFPSDPDLARETVQQLRLQDDEIRARRFLDVRFAIIEILLAETHSRKRSRLAVGCLAQDVNALLRSRGEIRQFSSEEIGWRLKALNIRRHTDGTGRYIGLDTDTSRLVHRLARAYDLLSSRGVGQCSACASEPGVTE